MGVKSRSKQRQPQPKATFQEYWRALNHLLHEDEAGS
jgi:hypothetical protein